MLKAIAVDDEPLALEVIRAHAAKVPLVNLVAEFTNAFKAIEYMQQEHVDLLLLDIKMPDISGIDMLQSLGKKPLVIFTTAYSEHAVISFELDAVDYLLKPFSLTRFTKACTKAFELYHLRNTSSHKSYMFLKIGYEQVKVFFDEIYYVEATGNYMSFVLKDKILLTRLTITEAEAMLPVNQFLRIHRSFIVAVSKIDKIERHQLTVNRAILPAGKNYLQNIALLNN